MFCGFVVLKGCLILGVIFDVRVVEFGCVYYFGIVEIKCLYIKYYVIFFDVCIDLKFFME